ncbi:MAG TPA: hypothetical protein VMW63_07980 [Methanoregulaceae archaeon]|nr:hypothetical protein [Methanoregulaceae archaeon]
MIFSLSSDLLLDSYSGATAKKKVGLFLILTLPLSTIGGYLVATTGQSALIFTIFIIGEFGWAAALTMVAFIFWHFRGLPSTGKTRSAATGD